MRFPISTSHDCMSENCIHLTAETTGRRPPEVDLIPSREYMHDGTAAGCINKRGLWLLFQLYCQVPSSHECNICIFHVFIHCLSKFQENPQGKIQIVAASKIDADCLVCAGTCLWARIKRSLGWRLQSPWWNHTLHGGWLRDARTAGLVSIRFFY